ncbi:uncharacterized protein LOC132296055 [Cornus florida]|uniref:uncharacterized protein LOC132296055 n=1 Tax=Cornus florida TaxID=4283 RepID=UPI00289EBED8|nr:uncharacterized protein LOC132296055 [Cornus florida]
MTTIVRILAYGCAADHYDEYIKIGKSTAIKCLKAFCDAIAAMYTEEYMCPPNEADIARLLEKWEQRGFPVALQDLWIWHALFGMPGSHNDINVLDHSPTIPHPTTGKEKLFAQRQEACRKDVERAFGGIANQVGNNARTNERHANVGRLTPPLEDAIPILTLSRWPSVLVTHIFSRQLQIRNKETNTRLRNDLTKNLWNRYADEYV